MDTIKAAAPLLLAAVADGSFLTSLLNGAAQAGMPHTTGELGAILGAGIYLAASQLFQRWSNRRQVEKALAERGITPSTDAL